MIQVGKGSLRCRSGPISAPAVCHGTLAAALGASVTPLPSGGSLCERYRGLGWPELLIDFWLRARIAQHPGLCSLLPPRLRSQLSLLRSCRPGFGSGWQSIIHITPDFFRFAQGTRWDLARIGLQDCDETVESPLIAVWPTGLLLRSWFLDVAAYSRPSIIRCRAISPMTRWKALSTDRSSGTYSPGSS